MSFANQALACEYLGQAARTLSRRRCTACRWRSTRRSPASSSTSMGIDIDSMTREQEAVPEAPGRKGRSEFVQLVTWRLSDLVIGEKDPSHRFTNSRAHELRMFRFRALIVRQPSRLPPLFFLLDTSARAAAICPPRDSSLPPVVTRRIPRPHPIDRTAPGRSMKWPPPLAAPV